MPRTWKSEPAAVKHIILNLHFSLLFDDAMRSTWERHVRNRIAPAFFVALSVALLVIMFQAMNFELRYGIGSSAVLFASVASSAFILFITPLAKASKPVKFVKSYVIAGIVGAAGYYLLAFLPEYLVAGMVIFAASALLIATRSEHAPALGIAFAFVLFRIDAIGILVVIVAVAMLLVLHGIADILRVEEAEEEEERSANRRKR